MIYLLHGTDREKIARRVRALLGDEYEVMEGENIVAADLPSIFWGTSLFGETRKILIKDLGENKAAFEKLPEFLETEHTVLVWETKLDKRTSTYKVLAKAVEIEEYKLVEPIDRNLAFKIYDMALTNGPRAAEMLVELERGEGDPYLLMGAWAFKAVDNFKNNPSAKTKRALVRLSEVDMQMKLTPFSPWSLLRSFLLRLS